jgi:hypothetical protein
LLFLELNEPHCIDRFNATYRTGAVCSGQYFALGIQYKIRWLNDLPPVFPPRAHAVRLGLGYAKANRESQVGCAFPDLIFGFCRSGNDLCAEALELCERLLETV